MFNTFKPFGTEALSSSLTWATIVGQVQVSPAARDFADHCSPLSTLDEQEYHVTCAKKLPVLEALAIAGELGAALAVVLESDVKLEVHACEPIALTPLELNASIMGIGRLLARKDGEFSYELLRKMPSAGIIGQGKDGELIVENLPFGWVPIEKFPAPQGERLLVRREVIGSPVGNPQHPGYGGNSWVEISEVAGVGNRFFCDFATTGRVTHWQPLPPTLAELGE